MQDRHKNQDQKQGQIAAAKAIIAQADAVSSELFETATALKKECHELIRTGDAKRYRKPPCTLAVKSETRKIGPKIVWVTFSSNKVMLKNAKPVRFTDEVRGRKNGRYPKRIFNQFDEDLRAKLWQIEGRAVAIRERVTFWRATINQAKKIIAEAEE